MRQPLGEDDRFVMPGGVGELDDAHLAAGARAPFGARHHRAGDAAGAGARAHGARKLRPRLHPHALEGGGIIVERVAGEEKTDGVEFLLQPLGRKPGLDLADCKRGVRRAAAEQFRLPNHHVIIGTLCAREHGIHGRKHARAIAFERIEGAGRGQTLQHALVHRARIDGGGEIGQIGEPPPAACLDDGFDCLTTDPFQRGQCVVDGRALDLEIDAGTIDRWRLDLHAQPLGLGTKLRKLVGIAHVEGHGSREEFHRIVRLHECGLIGDQCVSGGVALVEAVIGEACEQFEDSFGLPALDVALDAAGHESTALLLHLAPDLLSHRPTQQIGFAERVAGEDLSRLHHLLLIDDDAEGLAQDRFELGMDVVRLLHAVLARTIGRDVGHRAGTIERNQRDDVLEAIRPHVEQGAPHALTFQLEDADRLRTREHGVGFFVIERDCGEIDLDRALAQQCRRRFQHSERLEAEKVELHQARLLHPFHVELGHRHVGLGIAIERHHLGQRPLADDDAGGVGRGVAVKPFKLLRDGEGARDHRVAVARRLQARLVVDRPGERDRIERVLRHELAKFVDLTVRHLQHAADVAQYAARLQRAEGDDLRHAVAAVAVLHVADDLVAPILAEVDIKIGHRDALGIEEALE